MHKSGFLHSITFNRFMLLLCGIYIGMVLFIHHNLHPDQPNELIDSQLTSATDVKEKLDVLELKNWIRTEKEFNQLSKDIDDLTYKVDQAKQQINGLKKEKLNSFNADCFTRGDEVKNNSFLILEPGVFVYSAYLDDRKKDVFIRVMVILDKKKKKTPIFCHTKTVTIVATQYEMCENHNKPFGGYIYSCLLPKNNSFTCPLVVSSTYARSTSEVVLPVIPVRPVSNMKQFGICISPLFGNVPKKNLVEFIELSQILGAEHFYFYDNKISNDMKEVLEYYENKKLVTIVPWSLPRVTEENNIWYHGQLIAHNDCLYRTMSSIEHVLFNDIDEYVIPHTSAKYWKDVFPDEFKDQYCGIAFSSAFFDPSIGNPHPSGLETMGLTGRTKLYSHIRTKIMAKPVRVFEIGIHHISKQNEEKWSVLKFKPEIAYLHHYRKCIGNYGMKCHQFEKDSTMFKYYHDVKDIFDNSLKKLNIELTISNVTKKGPN